VASRANRSGTEAIKVIRNQEVKIRNGGSGWKARTDRWCGQQAVHFVGDRAGGGGRGRADRADVSERTARGERPRTGGEARESAGPAVRRHQGRGSRGAGRVARSRVRRARFS